jgi:hypothetical protein
MIQLAAEANRLKFRFKLAPINSSLWNRHQRLIFLSTIHLQLQVSPPTGVPFLHSAVIHMLLIPITRMTLLMVHPWVGVLGSMMKAN